jgi:predicted Zn-dependent protease
MFVSILFHGCARNPVTGKQQMVLMSESQEIAMGKEADPQIVAQFGLYPDSSSSNISGKKGINLLLYLIAQISNMNSKYLIRMC